MPVPESHTPWAEYFREKAGQMADGAVMEMTVRYRRIAEKTPRHNH